jgi:hypothetical protein
MGVCVFRFGRIPETDDIIGSVLVKGNVIQEDTYQPMPTYRLVTREGPMKLSDFLLDRLRTRLKQDADGREWGQRTLRTG